MSIKNTNTFELEFIIIGAKFNVEFEEGFFDKDEQKDIKEYIESLSNVISIDKSYVECNLNARKSTFMIEDGWNSLRDMLIDTEYGKYLHPNNYETLIEAFSVMAQCYLYECLSLKTEYISHINISIKNEPFDVVICKDKSNDWKSYKGKWQDWKFDDDGYYIGNKNKVNNE